MAKSNKDRIGEALDLFRDGVRPFVVRELEARHGDQWLDTATGYLGGKGGRMPVSAEEWDVAALVDIINADWQYLFRKKLDAAHRSLMFEVKDFRNKWAHQQALSTADTVRALDTIKRALDAVSAADEAGRVDALYQEAMRARFGEMQRTAARQMQRLAVSGDPAAGLSSWRDVIQPHPDVASGRFSQAEFAADLAQVHRGGAPAEYGDPKAFFRRTYLTEGLRGLLVNALRRLNGQGGHPVIELQTNFGGGKTHSMLALYHLMGGTPAGELAGVDELLTDSGLSVVGAKRAVIVGTALSAGKPEIAADGTELRTLWGRMAHQLLGAEGYAMVAECDRNGSAPGSDDLVKLFTAAGPCLILIDEWVAYCRQMYETPGLPGGTFDANLSFAQALTEAVKAAPTALLVASLPQSQIEVGGEGGQQALSRLENTFARLEFNWQPARQDESYEIVRRRLFEPMAPEMYPQRDAVVNAFFGMYERGGDEYPSECRELPYRQKLESAYPIHPEFFDRLYTDWSRLDQFQRTRGVLRLMAAVIHALWQAGDKSPLIMPCHLALNESDARDELTRHSGLAKSMWDTIIEKEIDGPGSLAMEIDREARYGRVSAGRRVGRTVYLGSAPVGDTGRRGVEIRRIRLGCVQPGESAPVFGDALRALTDSASHLYNDGSRYWYDTQPSVNRTAQDRASQRSDDDVLEEIRERLRVQKKHRGMFAAVHPCPDSDGEVPDDREARLVILDPSVSHVQNDEKSTAMSAARSMLERRGSGPRLCQNALVFTAADKASLDTLRETVRMHLAWASIVKDAVSLDLTPLNRKLAEDRTASTDRAVDLQLGQAFQWLIVPRKPDPIGPTVFDSIRLKTSEPIAERASKRLKNDGLLQDQFSATMLLKDLDEKLWQGRDHIRIRELCDYYAHYIYLQRLTTPEAVLSAIRAAVGQMNLLADGLGFAEGYDERAGRYRGLVACDSSAHVRATDEAVVVRAEIAKAQLDRERPKEQPSPGPGKGGTGSDGSGGAIVLPKQVVRRRFYGSVSVDPLKASKAVGQIAENVLAHLGAAEGVRVRVTLDVEAESAEGFDETTIRTVLENCRVLKFSSQDFAET